MDLGVLLPEELQRDAVALQLTVDVRALGSDPLVHRCGAGEQPGLQRRVVELDRQWPAKPGLNRPPQIAVDRAHADGAHPGHGLVGQSLLVPEPQHLADLPHQQPPCRHRFALLSERRSVPQSGYRRAFTIPGADVPLPPKSMFPLRPESAFHFVRNTHGAGVKAVSPAERGRSAATRLDAGEHTQKLLV